jgi:NitT/TauT family transport system substrate-binding protein
MSDTRRAVGRISVLAAFAVAMWAGEVAAEAPEIRFARQFSMGYLQFNVMEREQQLEKPGVRTALNSYDVFGGPHTFTLAWTSSQFRDRNPELYKALIAAFEEATGKLNQDVRPASQYWIDNVKSKMSVDKAAEIAGGQQVKWTMVPEQSMRYADFMHSVGGIKTKPASWKVLFFPEIHHLPGS